MAIGLKHKKEIFQETPEHINSMGNKEKVQLTMNALGKSDYFIDPQKLFVKSFDKFSDKIKAKKIISIEIDSSGYRLLYLSSLYHRYQIKRLGEEPFAIKNIATIKNDIKSIPRILKRSSIQRSEIVLCLSGPEIFVKTITVPRLTGSELREAIYWTINKDAFIISDRDIWDYLIIGEDTLNGKPGLKALFVSVHHEYIWNYLEFFKSINVQPDRIITKPIAQVSALRLLMRNGAYENKNFIIVDLSKDYAMICLCLQGNLDHVRTIPLTAEESEKAYLKFLHNNTDYDIVFSTDNAEKKSSIPRIVNELKRSIVYYQRDSDIEIDSIIITGRGSDLEDFDNYLSVQLGISVLKLRPSFPKSKYSQRIKESDFTAVLGAATSKFNLYKLLPKDMKHSKKYKTYQKILIAASIIVFIFLILFSFHLGKAKENQQLKHNEISYSYSKVQKIDQEYSNLIEQVQLLNTKISNIKKTLTLDTNVKNNLKILSNYTPDDISLDNIEYLQKGAGQFYELKSYEEGKLIIRGRVYKNFVFADHTLENFISQLKAVNMYNSLKLEKKIRDVEAQLLIFELNAELR